MAGIDKDAVTRVHFMCRDYLRVCNRNQVNALWEYINIKHRYPFTWKKSMGATGILAYWVVLEENKNDEYLTLIWEDFTSYWTFILGMLMVQDEYNKYNPNWKSPIRK